MVKHIKIVMDDEIFYKLEAKKKGLNWVDTLRKYILKEEIKE